MKVNIHFRNNEALGICEKCEHCRVVQMANERYVNCGQLGWIKKTVERCDFFEIKGHMPQWMVRELAWVPVLNKKTKELKTFRPPYEEE